MMIASILKSEKGVALLTVYTAAVAIVGITAAAYSASLYEYKHVQREVEKLSSYAAAEAGVQSAVAQMGFQGYTGFINTTEIDVPTFQSSGGAGIGSFSATLEYPDQADWVIVTATGNVGVETRSLEARIFLESNFSKYLVYADTKDFGSGANAQYGYHNGVDPEGVPSNEDDRAAMYFTGEWSTSGSNVSVYGDVHSETNIDGNSTAYVHGDTYVGSFSQAMSGLVTNDGISGGVTVTDGFSDDLDRDNNGVVDAADEPDKHDLTADGAGDSHKVEQLVAIDNSFYEANNSTPQFAGSSSQTRYLEFVGTGNGYNQIVEYDSADFDTVVEKHLIGPSSIVYVKGDIVAKGEIEGRVTVVSNDDILFADNVTYKSGASYASSQHSTAFFAQDRLYFLPNNVEVSGILYAQSDSGSSTAFNSGYRWDTSQSQYVWDPYSKSYLRLYGNRVINGGTNLGNYDDRIYGYDSNLKYFRPPGIPVFPDLRIVREVDPAAGGGPA